MKADQGLRKAHVEKKHQAASQAPLVLVVTDGVPGAIVHLPHCTKVPPEARG